MKTFNKISSALRGADVCRKSCRNLRLTALSDRSAIRIIMGFIVFFLFSYRVPGGEPLITEEMRLQSEKALFYYEVRNLPFSEELLQKCLDYEGVKYQDIVMLQSRLETGHYTSDIFLNGNNLFGMRYPNRRPTVATGVYNEHAQYAHWSDSVIDYALWQKYYLSRGYRIGGGEDNDFYLIFLKCVRYAEDPRYVPKLVEMSQREISQRDMT